ncbi:MAG: aspartate aminotransferase family protein [Acidimicrobiaceae bacterium]|nr:aspartate aminotransferase family protein [Acidimicrobiaceae bacterium]MAP99040.1 aspartate aminotransferase family protein [Acidimicrobiaceae bacterium]HAA66764.1 aspartate aminotransferase family protein [Acidimicrobiaceae bacterium]HCK73833.1 aspartate aminotransferase family protein [Acidimicrobiaceae bacterium]|tara:strand:+ start:946 stop:2364 length:1419 start_codon:yes stop_codon:yes gene_type:complete
MAESELPQPPEHLSSEEFRKHGHALIDWIADYWDRIEDLPVESSVSPGSVRELLPPEAPQKGEPFADLIRDLDEIVMPGITHWQHPSWFSFFPANASPPSVLAELVSAGLGVQGMLWSTSPAATEIESHVLDWLVDLMDLPSEWKTTSLGGGVLQMSASDSTHTSLVVARHQAMKRGVNPTAMVAYASTQTHSSIQKGATVAGYRHIRLIPVDDKQAMDISALRAALASDKAEGLVPVFVAATLGTTGTTAVDPIRPIGEICQEENLWLHVDAAYAGNAMICPEFRHHQDGLELVDSYTFNPHKWLMVNFDCSVFYVADRSPLIDCLSILPPYLKNEASESGAVIDYRDWHVPLGRRFRSLKLWWVIRSYGVEGLQSMIRYHVALTERLAEKLKSDPRFEVVAPHPFALVCFRCTAGDEATQSLAEAVNGSPNVAWTGSELDGRPMIRVSIGQRTTDEGHVDALWDLIDELA